MREALAKRDLETPMQGTLASAEDRRQRIETHFTEIMRALALDLRDDSLVDTPRRVTKLYADEIFGGLDYRNFPKLTVVENKMACDEMIRIRGIGVSSTCEHHFVTIDGSATVAYLPKARVIGLSRSTGSWRSSRGDRRSRSASRRASWTPTARRPQPRSAGRSS